MIKMAQLEDIRKMYFMEGLSIREINRRSVKTWENNVNMQKSENLLWLDYPVLIATALRRLIQTQLRAIQ
jgi:hypothetical protein